MPIQHRIRRLIVERRLRKRIWAELAPEFVGAQYLLTNPGKVVRLVRARPVEPDDHDIEISRRAMESYRAMRKDLERHPRRDLYYPSSLWKENILVGFRPLFNCFEHNDVYGFARFLSNSLSSRQPLGIMHGGTGQDFHRITPFKRRYLQNEIFLRHLELWQYMCGYKRPIKDLDHTRWGNPHGAEIDGTFLTAHGFFHEYYSWIFSQLLREYKHPVMADLGGGYGTQIYYMYRKSSTAAYVNFDLPEVLAVASYFLIRSFPNSKTLLYGENDDLSSLTDYDFALFPPQAIERLPDRLITLFVNTNSLGEMQPTSVQNYITHISRLTKYFAHRNKSINHRVFPHGGCGLISDEYDIPETAQLLWRYPCVIQNVHRNRNKINFKNDTFWYIYRFY